MNMHFRLTCNLVPDDNPPDSQRVATFFWMVKKVSNDYAMEPNWAKGWWCYPGKTLCVRDFTNGSDSLDIFDFTINTHPGQGQTFTLLDSTFQVYTGPSHLDPIYTADSLRFRDTKEVRMCIYYWGGNQTFQVHKVEAWDEGYEHLIVHPDSSVDSTIVSSFSHQWSLAPGRMVGWYYDEWQEYEQILPFVKVNQILQNQGLPTMFTNGWNGWIGRDSSDLDLNPRARNTMYEYADSLGVDFPVMMDEFYFTGGATSCISTTFKMNTSTSSDVPYLTWTTTGCTTGATGDCHAIQGQKSLQCTLDQYMYGWSGLYANHPTLPEYTTSMMRYKFGLLDQIAQVHAHHQKFWSMVITKDDDLNDTEQDRPFNVHRAPTPNEIKLGAWLSVACGADGLIYYPVGNAGGLLDWNLTTAFDCDSGAFNLGNTQGHLVRTDRSDAAAHVDSEIVRISPILDNLNFVKTYSSRAFEENYHGWDAQTEGTNDWTKRDNLCTFPSGDTSLTSYVGSISTRYDSTNRIVYPELANNTFVQISRFQSPNIASGTEDYWFLVVNRRAISMEGFRSGKRLVDMCIKNIQDLGATYCVDAMLADSSLGVTKRAWDRSANFTILLQPAEAELLHFYRQDTTDLVITTPTEITAPSFWTRNIVIQGGGCLTIAPTTTRRNTGDSVATIGFCANKGIIFKGSNGSISNKLSVLGNDSVKICLRSSFPISDNLPVSTRWRGISCSMGTGDTVILRHAEITGALSGLQVTSKSKGICSIANCTFTYDTLGVLADQNVILNMSNCFLSNNRNGMLLTNGANATIFDCEINRSTFYSLWALFGCTVNLENTSIHNNGMAPFNVWHSSSVLSMKSDVRMKCSRIFSNNGKGLEVIGGSLIMADNSMSPDGPQWGGNQIAFNSSTEVTCSNLTGGFVVANGHNQIFDTSQAPDTNGLWIWIKSDTAHTQRFDYRGNYWGGADSATIRHHILPVVSYIPVFADSQLCNLSQTPGTEDCYAHAVKEEAGSQYSLARQDFKDIIGSVTDCGKKSAINRLTAVDLLGGFSNDSTKAYLKSIADTTNDIDIKHAANMGVAFTYQKSASYDSARMVYETVLANAADSVDKLIDGYTGLLMLDMAKRMDDTTRVGLTADELKTYMDALDNILKGNFVWSQQTITDSVVMYAPCKVEGNIWITQGGSLTILPIPGVANPTVTFDGSAHIDVDGLWPSAFPRSKLYIHGTAEQPVTLEWSNMSGYNEDIMNMGYMELKHAILRGHGVACDVYGSYVPIIKADSCTFINLDEGLWIGATDSASYITNCTFDNVGDPVNNGAGIATTLQIYDNTGTFHIENCHITNSGDYGIVSACNFGGIQINNTVISGCQNSGMMTFEGAAVRMECSELSDNGDSLAEIWADGGTVDMVGSRNAISDSTGTLIYASNPAYVDLEDGENSFTLFTPDGRYLQSADTTSPWDITMNAWSPAKPTDSNFYNYLWPHTAAKWTVDSSLASFLACGMGESMSVTALTQPNSSEGDDDRGLLSVGDNGQQAPSSKLAATETMKGSVAKESSITKKAGLNDKASKQVNKKQLHHEELTKWREVKDVAKSGSKAVALDATMKFINDHSESELIPAALISMATLSNNEGKYLGISDHLLKLANDLPRNSDRVIAKRLGYRTKANEGKPAEALAGLESMMDASDSPQDSIRALVDAMGVCYFNKHANLHPNHSNIAVADRHAFTRRIVELAKLVGNPELLKAGRGTILPTKYVLYQNYPNPFNPTTEIKFDLPEAVKVELKIYNVLGQEVTTLLNEVRPAGAYRVIWDSKSSNGASVASGVYVYQLKAGNFTSARKMVLMR
jgi:hypothetical protein